MALKSILVALGTEETDAAAATAAAIVAAAHDAHLIGLHVVDIPALPGFFGAEMPSEIYEIQRNLFLEAAEDAEQRFNSACRRVGIDGEWRCIEGNGRAIIETHARYTDLLCVGGPSADDPVMGETTLSEDFVFTVGKPVLVCPVEFSGDTIGDYVTIAWNGSREAARAVSDAMSILARAKKVSVVSITSSETEDDLGALPGTDISHYLARHHVEVEAQSIRSKPGREGKTLLEWTKGQGADLLVMGAYGHSRFREVLLGGVTRWVLRHSRVPILISH